MSLGSCPARNGEPRACENPPLPSPNKTVASLLRSLATTRSGLPSPLKSPISTLPGPAPTPKRKKPVTDVAVFAEDDRPQPALRAVEANTAKNARLPPRLIPHRHRPRGELPPAHELQVDTLR